MEIKVNDYCEPEHFKALNEAEALRYPPVEPDSAWLFSRLPDGTPVRP